MSVPSISFRILALALGACALFGGVMAEAADATSSYTYKILASNDLGMHCVDADFSVFSILPPYNVVNAQVLRRGSTGKPVMLNDYTVRLQYVAVADGQGSVNSSCRRSNGTAKSNFWTFAAPLYGATLKEGQGLKGLYMPKDAPSLAQRTLGWSAESGLFKAEGVPILPVDDAGNINRYPLMRLVATERSTGRQVASLDVVLPVSEETTCADCHATGKPAASPGSHPGLAWSANANLEIQSRENVLKLHDFKTGTQLDKNRPVLCARCHYSPALDLAGSGPSAEQQKHRLMSAAMHAYHASRMPGSFDRFLRAGETPPSPAQQSCYACHPGKSTQCLRGAMTATVVCQNCHGDMSAVGGATNLRTGGSIDGTNDGKPRRPWADLPRCQSCHTGDAVNRKTLDPTLMSVDGLRLLVAFDPADPAASPFLASNKRFAENDRKLFRFSKGHGGVACEGCHNSTHAIWENPDATHNDNVAARQIQGHAGTLVECSACHPRGALPLTLSGPHGMHNVADPRWTKEHHDLVERNLPKCAACHGKDFRGTVLSRTAAVRTWSTDYGTRTVPKGHAVGCHDCHSWPFDDD
jgi:hypothetical protein